MDRGYKAALPGDTVLVGSGVYPANQVIKYVASRTALEHVTFRAASDGGTATIPGGVNILGKHITLEGINIAQLNGNSNIFIQNDGPSATIKGGDVVLDRMDFGSLFIAAADDIKVLRSDIGPSGVECPTCTTAQAQGREDGIDIYWYGPNRANASENLPERILIEGNRVHDAVCTRGVCGGSGSHSDAIQIAAGQDITVRNNLFTRGNNQSLIKGDQGILNRITFENNMVDAPGNAGGENTQGISLQISGTTPFTNGIVAYNDFNDDIRFDAPTAGTPTTVTGNLIKFISATTCNNSRNAGYVWDHNGFGAGSCGTSPYTFTGPWAAAFDNATPTSSTFDMHLVAGAEPVDKGSPTDFPADDFDGQPRIGTPDLGADERP